MRSAVSKSSSPTPGMYRGCQLSWHAQLCAWPWNAGTSIWRCFNLAWSHSNTLELMVISKAQPMSYPKVMSSPRVWSSLCVTARPYLALKTQMRYTVCKLNNRDSQFTTLNHVTEDQDESMPAGSNEDTSLIKHLPYFVALLLASISPMFNACCDCIRPTCDIFWFVVVN